MTTRQRTAVFLVAGLVVLTTAGLALFELVRFLRPDVPEEVRRAVDAPYDAPMESPPLGNEAIEHLRTMAESLQGQIDPHSILLALREIGTQEAAEFYVEILAGSTRISSDAAIVELPSWTRPGNRGRLDRVANFQETVLACMQSESALARRVVAIAIADYEWHPAIPDLRTMLEDEDLGVRDQAASSLRELTGEVIDVVRPPVVFPRTELLSGLLSEPIVIPSPERGLEGHAHFFLRWFDGTDVLVQVRDLAASALDADLVPLASIALPGHPERILSVPLRGHPRVLVLHGKNEHRTSSRVALFLGAGDDGTELAISDDGSGFERVCVLKTLDDRLALLLSPGGSTGIVALALDGQALWDVPRQFVIYDVSTHDELPGWFLVVGGRQDLFQLRASGAPRRVTRGTPDLYASSGLLFPTDDQRPNMILAGTRPGSDTESVMRVSQDGRPTWRADLPSNVEAFRLLEPPGKKRVVAALSSRGDVLLFDLKGTLLYETRLPVDPVFGPPLVEGLEAGPLSDGHWALSVDSSSKAFLYRLDASLLRDR